MQKVLVIVGPTASGKSALAVRLALRLGSGQAKKLGYKGVEIISADSRQVYKGLNVGTGKITKAEMQGIPHHLLDVADPKKQFSVSDYKELAEKKLRNIITSKKLPIVVGGTGFYIDTLAGTISLPEVPPNKLLRKKLEKLSTERLFKMLKEKDSRRAKSIDPHNKVRLVRALEIVQALGKVPIGQHRMLTKYKFIYIGLKSENLEKKIYKRLLKRIPGIIRETKKLSPKRAHELGLEYRFASLYLQGKLNKLDMVNKLNTAIRQYSRRQMTWFKRNKKIKWFTLSKVEGFKPEEYRKIEKYTTDMLR